VGLLLLLALTSCQDANDIWSQKLQISGPYRVGQQVVWLDGTRGLAFALDGSHDPPRVRSTRVFRNITFARVSNSGDRLLVLSSGKEAEFKDQLVEEPALTILRTGADGPEVEHRYVLTAPFDRLVLSKDDKYAIAHVGGSGSSTSVFRNPNLLALVDLSREQGADNPQMKTIRSFGSAPLGALISPPITIAPGVEHTLAVVLSRNYITLFDLENRERNEITVRLTTTGVDDAVVPEQVLFAAAEGALYVRARGSEDIFEITLAPKTTTGADENDFRPLINQPSAGRAFRDMLLYTDSADGKTKILAATADGQFALIDAGTSEFSLIPMGVVADTLIGVPADNPQLAIAFSQATIRSQVHLIHLTGLETKLDKNVVTRTLARGVRDVVPIPGGVQALVVHDDARTVVSVLDLVGEHHTDTPILGERSLGSFDFVGADTASYLVGVSPGVARLGILQLDNLQTLDLRLDYDPRTVIAVGDQLVIDHGAAQGLVTVVPQVGATREQAHVVWGFLLGNVLDSELKD
jgi:hypothetical protein